MKNLNTITTLRFWCVIALICTIFGFRVSIAADGLTVERKAIINAGANDVWQFAGNWAGIDALVPGIEKVESDGNQVGAIRTLTLPDGAVIKERLESIEGMSYSYVFTESPLPVSDYEATISVIDSGDGKCEFSWVGNFKANGVTDDEAKNIFIGIYEGGIAELQKNFP